MNKFVFIFFHLFIFSQESFFNDFDFILKNYVDNFGRINYQEIKNKELSKIKNILNELKNFDYKKFETKRPNEDIIAFWINTYNFLIISEVVNNYPINSIQEIENVWKNEKHIVAGKKYSFDYIEHKIIAKKCNDPRFHFALICAAYSCSKLQTSIFTGRGLKKQFEVISYNFFLNDLNFHLDEKTNTLYVSKIFEWYKDNFKINKEDLSIREITINYILNNAAKEITDYIRKNKEKLNLQIMPWYWHLNQSL